MTAAYRAPILAVALTLGLTACGGSSYSHQDWVASADAICADSLHRTRAIPPPTGSQLPALAAYLGQVVPIIRAEAAHLHHLRRPSESKAAARARTAFLNAEAKLAADEGALRAAAGRGDDQAVATIEAELRAAPVATLAAAAGVPSCGAAGATAS